MKKKVLILFRKVQLSGPSTSSPPLTIMPKQLHLSPSARNPDFPRFTLGRACRFVLGLASILPTRSLCHGRGGGRAEAAAEPGRGARRAGPGGGLGGVRDHRARQALAQRAGIRARRRGRTAPRRVLRQGSGGPAGQGKHPPSMWLESPCAWQRARS
jgi:hypothetical protein